MKKILCIIALLSAFVCSHAQFSKVTHIDDLALIYIGSQHRPRWDKDLFRQPPRPRPYEPHGANRQSASSGNPLGQSAPTCQISPLDS